MCLNAAQVLSAKTVASSRYKDLRQKIILIIFQTSIIESCRQTGQCIKLTLNRDLLPVSSYKFKD